MFGVSGLGFGVQGLGVGVEESGYPPALGGALRVGRDAYSVEERVPHVEEPERAPRLKESLLVTRPA